MRRILFSAAGVAAFVLLGLVGCRDGGGKKEVVSTIIGKLTFKGGFPTQKTIEKVYDQIDVQRVAQAYIDFMPAVSLEAFMQAAGKDHGLDKEGDIGIYTEPGEGKSELIGLTYNTESIYAFANIDLKKDGPTVVEVPSGILGAINNARQRWITDVGKPGPDQGKGGKYLILPPGYEGKVDKKGYFVFESPTYKNWAMVRGYPKDTGTGQDALDFYKKYFKVYPLKSGPRKDAKYESLSFKGGNTTHPNDSSYFVLLNNVVQYEPTSAFTPYELGLLDSIGIRKGKPFAPDARMKKMFAEGVKLGHAMARVISYNPRLEGALVYKDRKYETPFIGGHYDFIIDGARLLDAQTVFHYLAIVISPAMTKKLIGKGSKYLLGSRDADNDFLMGDNTYKLNLPKNIPAKNFWSVTLYDPDTRSLLQNGQKKPSVSLYDKPDVNPDGSIDVWFGPKAPKGKEKNWVKTIPGKGWFTLLRFYGPLEPYFEKTWKPSDIEKVK